MTFIQYRSLLPVEGKIYRKIRLESLRTFPSAYESTYLEAIKTEKLRIEDDIENQTIDRFVYGAFSDRQLVGICTFVKNEDHTGSLYQIYVQKEFHGTDVASELVRSTIIEVERRFPNIEVFLEVTSDNQRAFYFYKKLGFKEVTTRKPGAPIVMKYLKNE